MPARKSRPKVGSFMDDDEKDLRKEIEDLEKLIEEVRKQNEEEKKRLKNGGNPDDPKIVRINLAADYSSHPVINLIIGFLINFILIFLFGAGLHLADAQNNFIYLALAVIFSLYEAFLKFLLYNRYQRLVMYSSGIIFFFANLVFFYAMDLLVFVKDFNFPTYLDPLLFVFLFSVVRIIIKNLYAVIIHAISARSPENK